MEYAVITYSTNKEYPWTTSSVEVVGTKEQAQARYDNLVEYDNVIVALVRVVKQKT